MSAEGGLMTPPACLREGPLGASIIWVEVDPGIAVC